MHVNARRAGLLAALTLLAGAAPARADTVTDWNDIASTAIVVDRRPAAARRRNQLRDGAGRGLRRGQRDRPRTPPVPRPAAGATDRLQGGGRRDRGVPGPRRAVLRHPARNAPSALRRVARGHRARREGGRHRRRRASRGRDARRPRGRRPQQPVHARVRHDARRLPAHAAAVRAGPRAVGRQRPAVRRAQRRTAAHPSAERAHEPGLCPRLQRDQERRRASQHHPHRRSDGRRDLLAGPRIRAVEPRLPHDRDGPRTIDRRQRADVRDGGPRRGGRGDRLLEQQVPLEHLAPGHRGPRGGRATGTR